jgi:acetyl esterase/lipase
MASTQANDLAELFGSVRARFSRPGLDLATIRDICEGLHAAGSEPEGVTYAEVDANGVPALLCVPDGCDSDAVLLHSHAGGTVVFSMHSDRKAAGHIAKATGVRALVVHFRRAPESKFPAQLDDVAAVYEWLLAQGIRPEKVATIGHSIGGSLAVGVAIAMRDMGRPLPGAILAVSSWFDPRLSNETIDGSAETDKLLSRPLLEFFRDSWLAGTDVAFDDPRVNLLRADLTGLPPICVYYGSHELLAGESIEFADRAQQAGVDVSLRSVPEGQHSFILAAGRVPEVDEAIEEIGIWLRDKLRVGAGLSAPRRSRARPSACSSASDPPR